ncbi:MAG: hypothetical protein JWQ36_263 [Enterovirga sp.]|jgi:hypothetical protein|nr:hypothetical protein [Enterovirga sp.]
MMRLPRSLFRGVNRCLAPLGLTLDRVSRDFDARLDDPGQLLRMHRAFGQAWAEWGAGQSVLPLRAEIDAEREAAVFYEAYLVSPYRGQSGGSRYNNLLLLFLIGKAVAPRLIMDSGTYMGASAWALRLSSPHARLLSFDLDLSRLRLRMPGVEYVETDWTAFDWSGLPTAEGLCYFDDHVDQARRLLEAAERGFPLAIFDDDFPVTSFAPMAGNGNALPKIEFVLDDELRQDREVTWVDQGVRRSWRVDPAYLDRARQVIGDTDRLPNTSHITGIHQTPYRLVAIRSAR